VLPVIDQFSLTLPIGTMVGPYEEAALTKFRVNSIKMVSDSVKASHISLKIANGDTAAVFAKPTAEKFD